MDEFKKIFCGTCLYVREENLRKFMEDSKMPKEDIDFLMTTKPTMKIVRKGNQVFHSMELTKDAVHDVTYEFGKEFEAKDTKSDPPMYHNKGLCNFENGKLTYESRSQLTGPRKLDMFTVMRLVHLVTVVSLARGFTRRRRQHFYANNYKLLLFT